MEETNIPADLKYTKEHEWLKLQGNDSAKIGITDYAQNSLGDIVFVELPELDRKLEKGEAFGVIESVKAASDLYSPVSGVVTAVNGKLNDNPETVNKDPYGEGWMVEIRPENDNGELMDQAAYKEFIQQLES